jgi:RHS repeat-associated protein
MVQKTDPLVGVLELTPQNTTVVPNFYSGYNYKYNGKELQDELGLDVYDYQARVYDPATPHFWQIDPLAEKRGWLSPYNYVQNNPISKIDPDGMLDGDYYGRNGEYLGNDGIDDKKVYVLNENFQANTENKNINWGGELSESASKQLKENSALLSMNSTEFDRVAANVYNESSGMPQSEKNKVASAMENRAEDYGGNIIKMTDKLMFNSDSHDKKMTETDRKSGNTSDYPPTNKNDFTFQDVSTTKYRDFSSTSKVDRNSNSEMKGAVNATTNQATKHVDLVNGTKNWRGDGKKHRFF